MIIPKKHSKKTCPLVHPLEGDNFLYSHMLTPPKGVVRARDDWGGCAISSKGPREDTSANNSRTTKENV